MFFLQSGAWLGGWQRRERRKQQRTGDRVKHGAPIYPEPGFCGECEPAFLVDFKPDLRNLGAWGPREKCGKAA